MDYDKNITLVAEWCPEAEWSMALKRLKKVRGSHLGLSGASFGICWIVLLVPRVTEECLTAVMDQVTDPIRSFLKYSF